MAKQIVVNTHKQAQDRAMMLNRHTGSHGVHFTVKSPRTNEEVVNETKAIIPTREHFPVYVNNAGSEHHAKPAHIVGFEKGTGRPHVKVHGVANPITMEKNHVVNEEVVTETLSKLATAADWIHDFVHSTNSKFKGKSRKERIRMALGAYYGKQNEERALDEARINEAVRQAGQFAVVHRPGHHLHDVIVKVTRSRGLNYYEVRGPNKSRNGTSTHLVHHSELRNPGRE